MRPVAFLKPRVSRKTRDRVVRWVGFAALVALLAMATPPFAPGPRDVAVRNTLHWSDTWHG